MRDDVIQELVISGPEIICDFFSSKWRDNESALDNYVFKAFKNRSKSLIFGRAYRKEYAAKKRQDEAIGESLAIQSIDASKAGLPSNPLSPCLVCGTAVSSYACSKRCSVTLLKFKQRLLKLASACDRVIEKTNDLKPHSATELREINGSATLATTLSWLRAIGYSIELTQDGYVVGGMAKLARELLWMSTPSKTESWIVNLLKMSGIRPKQVEDGWLGFGELTTAQQIMLYKLRPWKISCIYCNSDVTPKQPVSLIPSFVPFMECPDCRTKALKRFQRRGWKV